MGKGGARSNAGRKPKSLQTHLLHGTYRRDRHGPLPVVLPADPPVPPMVHTPLLRSVMGLLLYGWADSAGRHSYGLDDPLAPFLSDGGLLALWQTHRQAIEHEAQRLGLTPWAMRHFDDGDGE